MKFDDNVGYVLDYFEKLSMIPRGSGNERAAADFAVSVAVSAGLEYMRDSADNVLVRIPPSVGRENAPSVLIQGHLDMVCEKNSGTVHDFRTDPIKLVYNGDFISAEGTTLGADDGIAVAMMLELISDKSIVHGPLEALFTTGEEIGLTGMKAFDKSQLRSRIMINLDSEEDNCAVVSCAGGVRSDIDILGERECRRGDIVHLNISGLAGGHSGTDINLGRLGAVRTIAKVISEADTAFHLVSLDGGGKDNAIPRECDAVLMCADGENYVKKVSAVAEKIKNTLCADDSGFSLTAEVERRTAEADVFSTETSENIINMIIELPSGVIGFTDFNPDLPETSANPASAHSDRDGLRVTVSSRSSRESMLDELEKRIARIAVKYGAKAVHRDRYPGWEHMKESALQDVYLRVYRELFRSTPGFSCIHAGLECGLVKAAIPDMDIISIGPNAENIHTPEETLSISSVGKIRRLLLRILSEIR